MTKIRVAIVDDQRLFRQGLAMLIHSINDFDLVIEGENSNDLLDKLKQSASLPAIALIDIDMPGMNGIELNQLLRREYPDIKTIMLSVHAEEYLINQVIKAGAAAYLVKNCDKDELVNTIKSVYHNGFYVSQLVYNAVQATAKPKILARTLNNQSLIKLTRREKQILQLICMELSNTEIAEQLFVSVRTVEGHRNNLLSKTGCRNTAGLVLFAVNNNLHTPQKQ